MKIRMLSPNYADAYNRLMLQALQQFPTDFAASDIQDLQQTGGQIFLSFNESNELIGAVGLRQEQLQKTRHKGLIWGMYVATGQQGTGVGKELLEAAIAHARGMRDLEQLHLVVGEHNTGAQHFYESFGFRPFGTEPRELKVDSKFYNGIHMWLKLS
jgi:ribosomal protein S18 acetylase RimI-like enzyme